MGVEFGRVRSEAFVNFSTCCVRVLPNEASFGIFLGSIAKFHSMLHDVLFAAGWDILLMFNYWFWYYCRFINCTNNEIIMKID